MFDTQAEAYAIKQQAAGSLAQYIPPTTRQNLEQQKSMLEQQLGKVNDALAALDQHPELESFMETIKAAQRY